MSLIGKITTGFILIISVIFLALSIMVFTTHKRWHKVSVDLTDQLAEAKRENAHLLVDNQEFQNQLAKERAWRAYKMQQLITKAQTEEDLRKRIEQDNVTLQANLDEATTQRDTAVQEKTNLTTENDTLKSRKRDLEEIVGSQQIKIGQLIDEADGYRGDLALANDLKAELAVRVTQQKLVMDTHGLTIHSVSTEPPALDGVITAVSPTQPLVQISLGTDDGLVAGHTLDVYRGSSYLGRIVIRDTTPNRSVGRIVKELQKEPFRRGDRVATKLG